MTDAALLEAARGWIDAAERVVVLTGAGRGFSSGGDQKRDRDAEGQQLFFDGDLGGGVLERLHRMRAHYPAITDDLLLALMELLPDE